MTFWSSKRLLINSLLSLISMIVVSLAFQNCSNGLSSNSPVFKTESGETSGMRVISDQEDQEDQDDQEAPITTDLKIELMVTDLLKVDCSLPGSGYKFEISNAGSDILMCQEYTLDMPQGNSRHGESYRCDNKDKFVPPPINAWSYDVSQRKWSKTAYTNSDQFIPGDYRLYVKDSHGEVRSAMLKMRHYGYSNCEKQNPLIVEQPKTGDCNPAGTILTRVKTELPYKVFPRTNYYPVPHQIHSFAFKTTSVSSKISSGMLSVAILSSSNTGKLAVISTCAGDIDTAGKDAGCSRFGAETSTVSYVVNNVTSIKPNFYCNLKPNTQYYFNVVPRETSNGVSNCTAKERCGFSFLGN